MIDETDHVPQYCRRNSIDPPKNVTQNVSTTSKKKISRRRAENSLCTELLVVVRIIGRPDADTFAVTPMVARSGVRAIRRAIGTTCCSPATALIAVDVLVTHTLDPHHILVRDEPFVL